MRHALGLSILVVGWSLRLPAQAPDDGWEIIYDSTTRIRLKDAHFSAGTRRLSWLAVDDASAKTKAKAPAGPEYLEFREDKTPMYTDDIVTYIPVASLQQLEYDHDKRLARATIKQAGDMDVTLIGPTKFANINKFSLEGTGLKKSEIGIDGALQIQDGLLKAPVRGFVQHGAKPVEAPTGRLALVIAQDKAKKQHKVYGLMPLYKVGAGQKLASVLMFQKVGQIDLAKIAVLRQVPAADKKKTISHDYEVTQIGGEKEKLTLLDSTQLGDNQKATLLGFVGRVAEGYRLFPPHTIAEVRFDAEGK